ncbi:MAG TPA: hypothetical protein VFW45_16055 [Candidatus Polarisedimenticolia bacterium]|nr:hypothetical protein [Candidatus Polarisedimenticolia bacterium]
MSLTADSSLGHVAAEVAKTLARAGIRAVLTGGACATLYSEGKYQSFDLDFILQSAASSHELDEAMRGIGFRRVGNHYEHARARFLVEFPAGPLGIGSDLDVKPVTYRIGKVGVRALSATDSCRDRLAAFYHWNDRQSLSTAVEIARRRRVNLSKIGKWSVKEGAASKFQQFLDSLERLRGHRSASRSR